MSIFTRSSFGWRLAAALLTAAACASARGEAARPAPKGARSARELAGAAQAGNVPQSVSALDFDGDGDLDLAVSNAFDDSITLLRNDGAGAFVHAATLPAGKNAGLGDDLPRQLLAADLNRDGLDDLAVVSSGNPFLPSNSSLAALEANRKGGFEPAVFPKLAASANPLTPFGLAAGVLDSHHLTDLVSANYGSKTVSVIETKPGFAFDDGVEFNVTTASPGPIALELADLDLDGDLDLVLANDASLAVMAGDGEGNFGASAAFGPGTEWLDALVSDFDNDGAYDVAAADYAHARVRVFRSVGVAGAFASSVDSPLPFAGAAALAAADFNEDGIEDLAVAQLDHARATLLLGAGDGSFAAQAGVIATGAEPRDVIAADLDGDGRADLATANEGDETNPANEDASIWINDAPSEALYEPILEEQSAGAAALGAGVARAAGAGWHSGRGTLFVAAPEEHALVEISGAGARIGTLDLAAHGAFDPSDAAEHAPSGDLFVTDRIEARVYRVTAAGALVGSFSTAADGAGRPAGIAYDPDNDRFIVSDEREERVWAYSPAGALLKIYDDDGRPLCDLTFDPATGFLWGFDEHDDSIGSFSFEEDDNELEDEGEVDLEDVTALLEDQSLAGIAYDPAGQRFFVLGPRALLIETNAAVAATAARELGLGIGFRGADGDPATGDVWILDAGRKATAIRCSGGVYTAAFAAQDFGASDAIDPNGIAFGGGSVFIASRLGERILRFSPAGALQATIQIPWISGREICGLEYDEAAGRLFVLSPGRIFKCDLSGALQETLAITLARRFGDLSLGDSGQIALYTKRRAEIWLLGAAGGVTGRAGGAGFLAPTLDIGGGSFDPSDPARHIALAERSAASTTVRLRSTAAASVCGWAAYP